MLTTKNPTRTFRLPDPFRPAYETLLGAAYVADSLVAMRSMRARSIDLILTSPPFALQRKKAYGNAREDKYVEWFLPFAEEMARILKPKGSLVLELGGAWRPGSPTRSLYQLE